MLRLAIISARGRLGTFTGALVALFTASVLAMAWGMQLEAILRTQPPVERYAGAAAVVTGQQTVGADHDVPLSERARVELRARHAARGRAGRPGRDRRRVGARSARRPATPSHMGGAARRSRRTCSPRDARPPRPDEVVTGYPATLGARLRARIDRAHEYRHRGRRRSPQPPGLAAAGDLRDRRRSVAAGRASRPGRRDRRTRRSRLRRLAPALRRRRRRGADRTRARPGRVSRSSSRPARS